MSITIPNQNNFFSEKERERDVDNIIIKEIILRAKRKK